MRSGNIRALAIASDRRAQALPDVPTFEESGYKDVNAYAFQGLIGPAGMPASVVARLNGDLNKALADPKLVAIFAGLRIRVDGGHACSVPRDVA